MSKRKIKTKETMTRQGAIAAIKELLAGLESGEISVGAGKDQLTFGVPDDMKVSFKGKLKGAKAKVTVSLAWKHAGDVPVEVVESGPPAKKPKAKAPARKAKAKTPARTESEKMAAPKKVAAKKPAKKVEKKPDKKPAKKKAASKSEGKAK